ncbi:MAG: hypothetical protein AB7K52_13840 [Phycisphaerales bacterium]
MHAPQEDRPARPLFTPGAIAGVFVCVAALLVGGYFFAFGGVGMLGRALGFGSAPAGTAANPGGVPPLQVCGRELGELKQATLGVFRALGELPSAEALAQTEGIPTIDPWGNPYRYHRTPDGRQFWFSSCGPDGIADNADDIETAKLP